jgi:hypothetical protein
MKYQWRNINKWRGSRTGGVINGESDNRRNEDGVKWRMKA